MKDMHRDSRSLALSVFACVVSFGLALLLMPTFQIGTYQDDALYINLASSIANGHGYVDLMRPENPPHTFVPPVYPLLLTPFLMALPYEWLLIVNFWPLQVMSTLLVLGGLGCFAAILRQRQVVGWVLVFALAALAPVTVGMAWHVMTEAPYFFFSMAALAALTHWANKSTSPAWLFIALTCAVLASTTRLIGLALLGAIALFLWKRMHPIPWLATVAAMFTPIALWFTRNAVLGTAAIGEYASGLTPTSTDAFVGSLADNLVSIMSGLVPNVLLPGVTGPQTLAILSQRGMSFLPIIMGAMIVVVVLIGYARAAKGNSDGWAIELYVALYLGILVATQFALDGGERYLAPIFPFLVLYFWQGSAWVLKQTPGFRSPAHVTKVMGIVVVLFLLLYLARGAQAALRPVRERLPDVTLGTMWLRDNTPADAIIMANGPREVYLYSGRKVVSFPHASDDRTAFAQRIACSGADFVLVRAKMSPGTPPAWDNVTQQQIVPTLTEFPEVFEETYASIDNVTQVYRIKRPVRLTCP